MRQVTCIPQLTIGMAKGTQGMARMDQGLAFMLKYENVAAYQDGVVKILDRRVYPGSVEYVTCHDFTRVAQAISDMVTQSGGPWMAALQGMVLTAFQVQDLPMPQAKRELAAAAHCLTHARPTTSERMVAEMDRVVEYATRAMDDGIELGPALQGYAQKQVDARYLAARRIAENVVRLLPDEVTIITQCFAETLIGFILLVCKEQGKQVSLICPETRPYLQGARLTASVAYDMGVPVTVITDNMPGYLIRQGIPDVFISAADVITLDGHVVNKIGTYQIALAAHASNMPFYVVGTPAAENPTIGSVTIEERDPEEVLHAMGIRTAKQGVKGYYPAFDITPPKLVSAVVTAQGVFSPYDLRSVFGPSQARDLKSGTRPQAGAPPPGC
jgi:methylthioribose-1-phosphate isomerase